MRVLSVVLWCRASHTALHDRRVLRHVTPPISRLRESLPVSVWNRTTLAWTAGVKIWRPHPSPTVWTYIYRKVNEQTGRDDFEKLDSAWAKVESRKLKVYLAPYKTKLPRGKCTLDYSRGENIPGLCTACRAQHCEVAKFLKQCGSSKLPLPTSSPHLAIPCIKRFINSVISCERDL